MHAFIVLVQIIVSFIVFLHRWGHQRHPEILSIQDFSPHDKRSLLLSETVYKQYRAKK